MTILITAFDPFGGEAINPAWEAVNQLDHEIAGAKIIKLQIPTAFMRASQVVAEAMAKVQPDYVLSIGQAGGRSAMTVEFVGINWQDGRIPDNDGFQPTGKPLEEAGDAAYFATLPTAAMVTQMRAAGVNRCQRLRQATAFRHALAAGVQHIALKAAALHGAAHAQLGA